eukprot:g2874.t1
MDTRMEKIASDFKSRKSALEMAVTKKKEMLLNVEKNLDSRNTSTKMDELKTDLISMLQTFERDRRALDSYAKRIQKIQRDMEEKSIKMNSEASKIQLDMEDKKNAELSGLNARRREDKMCDCFNKSEDALSQLWAEERSAITEEPDDGGNGCYYFVDHEKYKGKLPEFYIKLMERALVLRKVALHFEGQTRRLLNEWLDVLRERDVIGSGDWQFVVQWETLWKKYFIEGKTLKIEEVPEIPDWMSITEKSYLQRFAKFVVRVTAWIELKKEDAQLPIPVSVEWDTIGKTVAFDKDSMDQDSDFYSNTEDGQSVQILFPAILREDRKGRMVPFCRNGCAQPIVCKAAKDIPALSCDDDSATKAE